tara:strand:- start:8133 stop:8330 length:198 start_codon:yes stop_codon:yes gene_type:complete
LEAALTDCGRAPGLPFNVVGCVLLPILSWVPVGLAWWLWGWWVPFVTLAVLAGLILVFGRGRSRG